MILLVDDSRYRLKVWIDTYLAAGYYATMGHIYEDNGTTEASNAVMYSLPNVPVKLLFFGTLTYDAVFTIGEPTATVSQGHNFAAYKYQEEIPVTIFAVDKTGLTAVKMLWQAELKLRKIAETYANGTGTLRVLRRTKPSAQYLGGFFLYSVECVLSYMRPAAIASTTAKISFYNGFLDDFDNGVYGTTVYTAEAGSTTIIHDDTLTEDPDFWNGRTVKMLTGTYAGVEKKITDFTTPELTVEDFAGNIDAGDTFLISNWAETENGNTATIDTYVDDWLGITVSASAGANKLVHYSYPSEATNHTSNLGILTTDYTKIRWRYICSTSSVKAQIIAVFASGTQTVLTATNNVGWTVGSATLDTDKGVLDHIRLYATAAEGTVYYDFIQVYKGDFTFPNVVGIEDSFQRRDATTGIPGMGGDSTQGLGTQSAEFDMTFDLTVSNDYNDWKRPQGTLAGKTDYKNGQVFWEIVHRAYIDPWVWIDTETDQFKATVSIQREERRGDTHTLTLHVAEVRESSANSEYIYQRLGMDQ